MRPYELIFEFPTENLRDEFLGMFSAGGIESEMMDALAGHNINVTFNYKRAFAAHGWDGRGTPIIEVIHEHDSSLS